MSDRPEELLPTRQSLLSRLKDWENQESWREFFDTYWHLIYGLARKCGLTDAEAQDVVQETMLAVAKQMPGFKYDPALGSFKGWLLQITRWRIADQFRKRPGAGAQASQGIPTEQALPAPRRETERRERTATLDRVADPASAQLDEVWEQDWKRHLLQAAIERVKRRVSPQQFQMFDLFVTQAWPTASVTSTLGVNRAQVYMAKLRVTKLIKQEVAALKTKGM
jgi:RNA polymerase sigma-70 factor (ECF subfamily)